MPEVCASRCPVANLLPSPTHTLCCRNQALEAALSRLEAFQPGGDGSARSQVPNWTQLLAAFAAAVESDAKRAVPPSAQSASADVSMSASAAAADPASEAVRRVQLWAQAMRNEQSAWDASATTTGGDLQSCAAAPAQRSCGVGEISAR